MKVQFRTQFPETVIWLLQDQQIITAPHEVGQRDFDITVEFMDDSKYPVISLWTGAAISCGLILSYKIERV